MRKLLATVVSGVALVAMIGMSTVQAGAIPSVRLGTVDGTLTTQGGLLLNGMCVNLYKGSYKKGNAIQTAATGQNGTNGFFSQANVPVGTYVALFVNCGANTNGTSPDFNYENIFYGNTFVPTKATTFTVTSNTTSHLGTNAIPLGGTITGNVQDATTGLGAVFIPVGILIPGAATFNLRSTQGWLIVCADASGNYSVSGVPTGGVKVVFAPQNWGCPDGSGGFNFGEWIQAESPRVFTSPDGTLSNVNGTVTETGAKA